MRAITRGRVGLYAVLMLTACQGERTAPATEPAPGESFDRARLEAVVAGAHRTPAYRQRDSHRHPVETLEFFGLTPDMHVVEIWPTGGWYTEIIAPYVRAEGRYYGAHFDSEHSSEFLRTQRAAFISKLRADPDTYGDAQVTELARGKYQLAPAGSVDMVLTFRNVHNWTIGGYAEEVFAGIYRALKRGGVLGIVDHRGEPHPPGDPETETGYLRTEHVLALAEAAGFELEASSEVNANPADTKDHPEGVWTLPPSLRLGPKNYDKYMGIGESDRMTLKFRKPAA